MLIIPIGHEDNSVRRLPWVTFTLMAVCVAVHILVTVQTSAIAKQIQTKFVEFAVLCIQHPSLEPDHDAMVRLLGERTATRFSQELESLREQMSLTGATEATEEDQARFDALALDLAHLKESLPSQRLGYVPAEGNFLGLLTSMFVHSGWFHLIMNMLFLYLLAPFIEDVWGRPLFLGFYLLAGVFSASMFGVHYPHLSVPLIGASGAIAGVMGAFLVRYWKTRIEFFYLIFFFVRGTFKAPAFVMLPLWFVLELFNARAMDVANPGGGGGVAHWAHVWGFLFGVAVALVMLKTRTEERHLSPRIEAQIKPADAVLGPLEDILALKRQRRDEPAFTQALALARSNPGREDIIRVLWGLSVDLGRESEAAPLFSAFVEREVRRNQMDAALGDFRSLKRAGQDGAIGPGARIALIQYLQRTNAADQALDILGDTLSRLDGNAPAGILVESAKLAAALNSPKLALEAIGLCLLCPDVPPDQKQRFMEYQEKIRRKMTSHPR